MAPEIDFWENRLIEYLRAHPSADSSHGLSHFKRVWALADRLAEPDADKLVILAAAYLHDIVNYPKNHPDRSKSSAHAAIKAEAILLEMKFPSEKLAAVKHCIEAHSFSANIRPESPEARAVQDADRMESLGAIGLARTFYVSGLMGSELFNEMDPFADNRELDDKKYAVDHFYAKLLKLPETMQTVNGRQEALRRATRLKTFLADLKDELATL